MVALHKECLQYPQRGRVHFLPSGSWPLTISHSHNQLLLVSLAFLDLAPASVLYQHCHAGRPLIQECEGSQLRSLFSGASLRLS